MEIGLPVLEMIFEGVLPYIWVWQPSWSCDRDAGNKLLFTLRKEAPLIGQAVSEKKTLENG